MATGEVASVSMGPQYAPEDPTLVKPWKGLIDGSTGVLYYWNPENNVTQYERPANLEPPPVAPTAPDFTPKLAPIPAARPFQPTGVSGQHGQQISQPIQQEGQQMTQGVQPWGQYAPRQQVGDGSQLYATHMSQGPQTAQGGQPTEQMMSQQPRNQSFQQPREQVPQHLGQPPFQHDGQLVSHPQGQRFPPQQVKHMPYRNLPSMNGQQDLHPQGQQFVPQEGHKLGYSHSGSYDFQPGKESRFPSSQQHGGQSLPPTGSSLIQQHGTDPLHRQQMGGPTGQNRTGQHAVPSVRPNMASGEDSDRRAGNGFYFNPSKEGPPTVSQPSKLAPVAMAQIQQEMRFPLSGTSSHGGVPNSVAGHSSAQVYNNGVGSQAFTNFTSALPNPGMRDSSAVKNISACEAYRREHEISATGDSVPDPFMTFEATGFPPEILREMHSAGFSSPTPIQAQTWPIAMQSNDIVAIAKTGSGKTLGYIIPAFMHLRQSRNVSQNGPTVLVLAPTRELATQIQEEVIKFGRSSRISCTCLYGGAPKGPQLKELERGADIVVATPGRLNDILEMKKIDFRQVSFLVLDEADRMLDMGFEPQIRTIVNKIPPRRQTLMYTATWPKEVRKIAGDLLVNPVQVNIGSVELAANKSITQYVEVVPQMNKQRRLEQILRTQERGSRAIIFCSTKRSCDQLARSIGRNFGAAAIHGDKSQGERDWVLNQFRSGKSPVLVATDVAARGLDVKDIRVVVNYDFPTGIEDYVHRIGRTGRAGAVGVAYTFFSDQDRKHAADLVKVLEGANQQVPPEVQEMAGRGGPSFSKFRGGMSRWDSGGERSVPGGRGGRASGFDDRGAMRDGGFGGRSGTRDGVFGGRGGRNNFGGRGNQGGRFSGGRHDSSPSGRYDNRSGQHCNGRDGRSFNRSRDRNPDMVSTWDTRSRSSSRSSSRSMSRSRSRSRSPSRFSSKRLPEQKSDRKPRVSTISPGTHGTSSPSMEPQVQVLKSEGAAPSDIQPVTSDV